MRRGFQAFLIGCVLWASPAAAEALGQNPTSLSAAYNAETNQPFRVGLQMRLAWAGDYSGAFDGDIDAASLRAIRDFQARHGMAASGIIDEAFLRMLIDVSDKAEADAGFVVIDDAATGTRIGLPTAYVRDLGPTEVGHVWRSDDAAVEIETVRIVGAGKTVEGLFELLRTPTASRVVTEHSFNGDRFTISGTEAGRNYVMRFGGRDGDIRGFAVSFDETAALRMKPAGTVALNLFDPFGAEGSIELVGNGAGDEAPAFAGASDERPAGSVVSSAQSSQNLLQTGVHPEAGTDRASSLEESSGTGFVVSDDGWLLTNAHVTRACKTILVGTHGPADKLIVDEENDLALVHVDGELGAPLAMSTSVPRLGEDILALGYPLRSILADSLNVTRGNVSSLLGLMNDPRYLQISAPVQPGNSGGPLVDLNGRVVGVVTAKLNAVAVADATGDIPQSINFAIRPDLAVRFLTAQGIDFTPADADGETASVADTTERVQDSIVPILCLAK